MKRYLWVLALIAAGCGGGDSSDRSTGQDADDRTVGGEVADQYIDSMDRANEAVDSIESSKDRIDAALDESADDDD